MKNRLLSISAATFILGINAVPAMAQDANVAIADPAQTSAAGNLVDSNTSQETNIKAGLNSGSLTDNEVARLQRGEGRIDRAEGRALKDGEISTTEQARLQSAEDVQNAKINTLESNNVTAGAGENSGRLNNDIQRNITQQQRIDNGIDNGRLTNTEVGALERGQARVNTVEARGARDGNLSTEEQERIRANVNKQRRDIYIAKHNNEIATLGQNTPNPANATPQVNTTAQTSAGVNSNPAVQNTRANAAVQANTNAGIAGMKAAGGVNNSASVQASPVVPHVTPHAVGR